MQQRSIGRFRVQQRLVVAHQRLLRIGQAVVGRPGRFDGRPTLQRHRADGLNQPLGLLRRLFIVGFQQRSIGCLRVQKRLVVAHQRLLRIGQAVVGRPGRFDGRPALQRHRADGLNQPLGLLRRLFICGSLAKTDIQAGLGRCVHHAGFPVPVLVLHPFKPDLKLRVLRCQRLGGNGDRIRHIPGLAVGVGGHHLHPGRVEDLAHLIAQLLGQLGYRQALDGAAHRHHVGGVVFKVQGAVLIHNGAANGILLLIAGGRKQHIGRLGALFHAVFLIDLGHRQAALVLPRPILQQAQLPRCKVIQEVDINNLLLSLIGSRQQAAGLGIALGWQAVGNLPILQVDHGDIVAGIGAELPHAADAHIGPLVVNHRRGGTHGRGSGAVGAVVQIQIPQGIGPEGAVLGRLDGVELAALGGEVVAVRVRVVADGAALVAHPGQCDLIDHPAASGVQAHDGSIAGGIAGLPVVGAHQQEAVADASACPIEAALGGIGPGGHLGFLLRCGILIGHRQAHIVRQAGFAVPKAGVQVSVMVDDGAVGLPAQRILIQPQ